MKIKSLITGAVLVLSSPSVFAQAALLDFSSSMVSFSADFTQTVYDSDSVALQESVGRVELLRPGRFRWTYTEPSKQVIVADGLSLWVYDEDIKQVTVQPQSATLGSAPIGLLSGEKTIESEFIVTELGEEKGLKWFELEPLVKDTDFNAIYIALDSSGINAMELRDNFDQATQIKFTNFKKNVPIDSVQFSFTPPDGADVVGEEGIAAPVSQSSSQQPALSEVESEDAPQDGAVKTDTLADTLADTDVADPASDTDSDLPPIIEGEPIVERRTTIIDGTDVQIEEIRE